MFQNNPDMYGVQQDNGRYIAVKGEITGDILRRHLRGELTLLVYSTSNVNTCKWICWDVDENDDQSLENIAEYCRSNGLNPVFQGCRTGRSGHLWLFFDNPVPTACAYHFARFCTKFFGPIGNNYESFPKQAALAPGSVGNGVRLPLGLHRKMLPEENWGYFRDCEEPSVAGQLLWVIDQPKSPSEQLLNLAKQCEIGAPTKKKSKKPSVSGNLLEKVPGDYPLTERVNGEVMTRCPVCAEENHDISGTNLYINPEKGTMFCHYNSGEHNFLRILDAFKRIKHGISVFS